MGFEIGWFSFDGPVESEQQLKGIAGVFAVLAQDSNGKYNMLDIDGGDDLAESILKHERRACWEEKSGVSLRYVYFALPVDAIEEREKIIKEVRMQYVMECSPSETPSHGWWRPDEQ